VPPAATDRPPVAVTPEADVPPVADGCPPVVKPTPPDAIEPPVPGDPPLRDGLEPPLLVLPPVWTAPPVGDPPLVGPPPPFGAPPVLNPPLPAGPFPPTRPWPPDPLEGPAGPFDVFPDEHATSPKTIMNCSGALRTWNTITSMKYGLIERCHEARGTAKMSYGSTLVVSCDAR